MQKYIKPPQGEQFSQEYLSTNLSLKESKNHESSQGSLITQINSIQVKPEVKPEIKLHLLKPVENQLSKIGITARGNDIANFARDVQLPAGGVNASYAMDPITSFMMEPMRNVVISSRDKIISAAKKYFLSNKNDNNIISLPEYEAFLMATEAGIEKCINNEEGAFQYIRQLQIMGILNEYGPQSAVSAKEKGEIIDLVFKYPTPRMIAALDHEERSLFLALNLSNCDSVESYTKSLYLTYHRLDWRIITNIEKIINVNDGPGIGPGMFKHIGNLKIILDNAVEHRCHDKLMALVQEYALEAFLSSKLNDHMFANMPDFYFLGNYGGFIGKIRPSVIALRYQEEYSNQSQALVESQALAFKTLLQSKVKDEVIATMPEWYFTDYSEMISMLRPSVLDYRIQKKHMDLISNILMFPSPASLIALPVDYREWFIELYKDHPILEECFKNLEEYLVSTNQNMIVTADTFRNLLFEYTPPQRNLITVQKHEGILIGSFNYILATTLGSSQYTHVVPDDRLYNFFIRNNVLPPGCMRELRPELFNRYMKYYRSRARDIINSIHFNPITNNIYNKMHLHEIDAYISANRYNSLNLTHMLSVGNNGCHKLSARTINALKLISKTTQKGHAIDMIIASAIEFYRVSKDHKPYSIAFRQEILRAHIIPVSNIEKMTYDIIDDERLELFDLCSISECDKEAAYFIYTNNSFKFINYWCPANDAHRRKTRFKYDMDTVVSNFAVNKNTEYMANRIMSNMITHIIIIKDVDAMRDLIENVGFGATADPTNADANRIYGSPKYRLMALKYAVVGNCPDIINYLKQPNIKYSLEELKDLFVLNFYGFSSIFKPDNPIDITYLPEIWKVLHDSGEFQYDYPVFISLLQECETYKHSPNDRNKTLQFQTALDNYQPGVKNIIYWQVKYIVATTPTITIEHDYKLDNDKLKDFKQDGLMVFNRLLEITSRL